jgi:dCTP deaminase
MIICAGRIAEYLKAAERRDTPDPLVIAPTPDISALEGSGAASIDLRLGTWFVRLRQARMSHLQIEAGGAPPPLAKTSYVPFGGQYYLHPRTFVLGITLEWIRLPRNMTAYVIGKSSWGRRGLIIATATGVHPGFVGCLTLELTNVGETPIGIKPGMKICQIFIHEVDTTGSDLIDTSQFIGSRKPRLGDVQLDEVALKLARGATGSFA